ncbi:MAG: L,D-transpeptidase [Saprospiraceae bacterium]|nr:L,D-transpeptidase [Saprospiraceae bacterium]MDW8483768.1 L,D-transpeptidase [Saprospiraceae bacterium]
MIKVFCFRPKTGHSLRSQRVLHLSLALASAITLSLWLGCSSGSSSPQRMPQRAADSLETPTASKSPKSLYTYVFHQEVTLGNYFDVLDRLVRWLDSLTPYPLTEHLLVHANPWLIDTLAQTDYYHRMARGEFVFDARNLVVIRPGDALRIPDEATAHQLQQRLDSLWLDLNIPEYRLRVMCGRDTLFSVLTRIGQNKRRFQQIPGRVEDLRTRTGRGHIVRINRAPTYFVDPHTGRRLYTTRRDDGRRTRMPQIPWIETEINGVRHGQMLHPTTNPASLGKASSNGCIGYSEADAWRVYYHAPLGTPIVIRYDVDVPQANGDTLRLRDIYGLRRKKHPK